MRDSGGKIDPDRWRTEVQEPVQALCRHTLPTLGRGFGTSVGLVMAGLTMVGMGLGLHVYDLYEGYAHWAATDLLDKVPFCFELWSVLVAAQCLAGAVVPFLLAADPAAASSKCARLMDDINHLCIEDPAFMPAQSFIQSVKRLNRDQGLGFVVGGQVVSKRTLGIVATGIYSIVSIFAPVLLMEVELEAECAAQLGGEQGISCPLGWSLAEGTCFKLFGEPCLDSDGDDCQASGARMSTPLVWAEAEEACEQLGGDTHLASVTSAAQQDAVTGFVLKSAATFGTTQVWIGLNDLESFGNFIWSDGSPLGYTHWGLGEPNNAPRGKCAPRGSVVSTWVGNRPSYYWGDACANWHIAAPYVCAKKPRGAATASGGDMLGCVDGHWVLGTCYKQPRSMGRLPPTIVGLMPLCVHRASRSLSPLYYCVCRQVPGMYKQRIHDEIEPTRISLNETVITTAAECAALVQRDHRTATAAEFSNAGLGWCNAVFEAVGVIYDPEVQTCLFEPL